LEYPTPKILPQTKVRKSKKKAVKKPKFDKRSSSSDSVIQKPDTPTRLRQYEADEKKRKKQISQLIRKNREQLA
jgi:hypothetical protein